MGATPERPPPGIEAIAEVVDLVSAAAEDELDEALPGADVLFAWRPRRELLEPVWSRATELRWIQSASAGVDGLLFPELVDSDVVLTNARGVFDTAIAEYTLGLLLIFAKGFSNVLDRQRRREWRHGDTELLAGKRVLVVGAGPVGHAIGRAAKGLRMVAHAVARTARPGNEVFRVIHGTDELADACGWADYVVNALPLTPETDRLFDEAVFTAMRPTARFVNVGRGGTVDEAALARAIEDGRLAGAALDVFEREPLPPESDLWTLPNVIVSPHTSGNFAGWREALVELFVENLERYLTGRPLRNVVDKHRGYVAS
ncbi:MAG TPA: D-2-hydroxyacid dehydrogenase [Actinomycetota bacterium]